MEEAPVILRTINASNITHELLARLSQIYVEAFDTEPYYEKWSMEDAKSILSSFTTQPDKLMVVALINESPVGFICTSTYSSSTHMFVNELAVSSSHRRRGIGSRLLDYVTNFADHHTDNTRVYLCSHDNNTAADNLYRNSGFYVANKFYDISHNTSLDNQFQLKKVYCKNLVSSFKPDSECILHRASIVNPTGNITAIVHDVVNRSSYSAITKQIMSNLPEVEQVGFLQHDNASNTPRLEMMGGEFCGNAILSMPPLFAGINKNIQLSITSSGYNGLIKTWQQNTESGAQITLEDINKIVVEIDNNETLVRLPGIDHLVVFSKKGSRSDARNKINKILQTFNPEALGVIYFDESTLRIQPYVYVRKTNTLVAENSCSSGSMACTIAMSFKHKQNSQHLSIIQPSNEAIHIRLTPENNLIYSSKVTPEKTIRLSKRKNAFILEAFPI